MLSTSKKPKLKTLLELKYDRRINTSDEEDMESSDLEQILTEEKIKAKQFDANKLLQQDLNDTRIERMKKDYSKIELSSDNSEEIVD
jgi:hypothetical protein